MGLEDNEKQAFDLGYMIALSDVVDQMRDSKIKLLLKAMDLDEEGKDREKNLLISRQGILEIYDKFLSKKIVEIAQRTNSKPTDETNIL